MIDAIEQRISDLPVPIRQIMHLDECPEEFLPWLAWERSVDVWNPDWPVEVKREVIRQSFEVHRRKGTPHALKTALAALGLNFNMTEWFNMSPAGDPFTFDLSVTLEDRGLSLSEQEAIDRTIESAKNTRSHLANFRLYSAVRGTPHANMASVMGEEMILYPWSPPQPDLPNTSHVMAMTIQSVDTLTVYPKAA